MLTANEQVTWWLENGAYPIHFVWETGLMETLGQLINPNRQRGLFDFDPAGPTDFAIESLALARFVFRINRLIRNKFRSPAAEGDFQTVAVWKFD